MAEHDTGPSPSTSVESSDSYWHYGEDDRYCPHCGEVALIFDPTTGGPQCRVCGKRV